MSLWIKELDGRYTEVWRFFCKLFYIIQLVHMSTKGKKVTKDKKKSQEIP